MQPAGRAPTAGGGRVEREHSRYIHRTACPHLGGAIRGCHRIRSRAVQRRGVRIGVGVNVRMRAVLGGANLPRREQRGQPCALRNSMGELRRCSGKAHGRCHSMCGRQLHRHGHRARCLPLGDHRPRWHATGVDRHTVATQRRRRPIPARDALRGYPRGHGRRTRSIIGRRRRAQP